MNPLARIALLVDAGASAIIAVASARAALAYLASAGAPAAADAQRRALAAAILLALSCKTGAGLVRSATLADWNQLGAFAAILALCMLLGRVAHRAVAAPAPRAVRGPAAA